MKLQGRILNEQAFKSKPAQSNQVKKITINNPINNEMKNRQKKNECSQNNAMILTKYIIKKKGKTQELKVERS